MIVVNTESLPGYEIIQSLGIVQGNVVRAKHMGRDIAASFKNIVGGELKGYTELLTEARRDASSRMIAQAEELGADAVMNVRFSTSAITQGAAELYVYGTAVKLAAIEADEPRPAVEGIPPPLPTSQEVPRG
ncbi:MAG: YbjQ family protein [Verrucomicrobia bacterium]|nr:YbjQ family protein [Verrucomicrobiota bacterium]MCH8513032.1 YbjQ family protein [Kiritimatiellia bacterium]